MWILFSLRDRLQPGDGTPGNPLSTWSISGKPIVVTNGITGSSLRTIGGADASFTIPVILGAAATIRNQPIAPNDTSTRLVLGDITLNGRQVGLFKSPSLRNVEFTAPYMHDGRLATLEAVIDHYSKEIKPHPNLDGRLRRRFNFSEGQKAALVAFLKTLSDPKFITDPKFSDPFQGK